MDGLGALRSETAAVSATLAAMGEPDWSRPTRCEPWTARELVAHMLRGASRIREFLTGPEGPEPVTDAVAYFSFDADAEAPGIAARAAADAEGKTGADLETAWTKDWAAALDDAAAAIGDDPILDTPLGSVRLSEYVLTRVVEVTVHHMDLCDAIDRPPGPSLDGLAVTVAVLQRMLGEPVKDVIDPMTFVLAGTGRQRLTAGQREALGAQADRFPLFH